MSRGFHAFFPQYYNLRKLLRRSDPRLRGLTRLADYPLVDDQGRRDTFRWLPRTPPWNAVAFALTSPTFAPRDLLGLDPRAAAPLAAVSVPEIYRRLDHLDADTFLHRINFPRAARHLALEVFARSFFAAPATLSAAELATMFHLYFLGSSEGLLFDVPNAAFDTALWAPLRDYLVEKGVTFRTGTTVTRIERRTDGFRVRDDTGGALDAEGVVLASDLGGLQRLLERSPEIGDSDWRGRIARLPSAPPFLVYRLWLDRPVRGDRPTFLATGGLAPLDNLSVLSDHEAESMRWAQHTGGSVVELHAYAAADTGTTPPAELRIRLLRRLHQLYPETVSAAIVDERAQWRQDCPLFAVGGFADRPKVRTPQPGLVLAGDAIRVDLPIALMERAATTGWHAANCLLARWGLAGHTLHSVPTRGRMAVLRPFAKDWLGT